MRISIVTPCFNMASHLGATIASVRANLGPDDEYFIVDGGSTDGSVDIIRAHADLLKGWVSEPDRSYADALAKGFDRATGDILCWINAGDLLLTGAFERVRAAIAETDADMIFGDDFYIDEKGCVLRFSRGWVSDLRASMLFGGWTPLQDACFWRRELYIAAGGINPEVHYAADYDLFLRMAMRGRTRYVPVAFSAFRRHAGQKSSAGAEAYHRERMTSRSKALRDVPGCKLGHAARGLVHQVAVRWRVHVQQRFWQRADLAGRSVRELAAATYWPRTVSDG
ncbi:MAG: glycosyltransferase [Hyphomonadaceae bacterium]|jgi:glycosyltransferase involved in cell wall biosynthesis|nr:glycosyltransferase [Hyphomonadaceae bacterium]